MMVLGGRPVASAADSGTDPSTTPTTAESSTSAPSTRAESATLTLDLCPGAEPSACNGIHVYVDSVSNHPDLAVGPADRYRNCVNSVGGGGDWVLQSNGTSVGISIDPRHSPACYLPTPDGASRNVWMVVAYRDNKLIERGSVFLGEDVGGLGKYYATCGKNGPVPWESQPFDGMECTVSSKYHLTLSAPGAKPTFDECPSQSSYCHLKVEMDATKPCLSLLKPDSFTGFIGICWGKSNGTPSWTVPYARPQDFFASWFAWVDYGGRKYILYAAVKGPQVGLMAASVTSDSSPDFEAHFANVFPGADVVTGKYWATGTVAPRGVPGGPLAFDFHPKPTVGADITLDGYMEHRKWLSAPRSVNEQEIIAQVRHLATDENPPRGTLTNEIESLYREVTGAAIGSEPPASAPVQNASAGS